MFKAGDIVKCVSRKHLYTNLITVGKEYQIVKKEAGSSLYVKSDNSPLYVMVQSAEGATFDKDHSFEIVKPSSRDVAAKPHSDFLRIDFQDDKGARVINIRQIILIDICKGDIRFKMRDDCSFFVKFTDEIKNQLAEKGLI